MYRLLRRESDSRDTNLYQIPRNVGSAYDCNVISPFTIVSHLIVRELLLVSDGRNQSEPYDELHTLTGPSKLRNAYERDVNPTYTS